MPERTWPPYRVGNADYIHALGVVASVFNLLEFRFRSFFHLYTRIPTPPAYKVFANMTNDKRLELVRECLEFSSHPDSITDDVRHFLSGYKTCADNRNILMHSTVVYLFGPGDVRCPELAPPFEQPQGVAFQKSPKSNPLNINTYQLTIEEIRLVADSLKSFEKYGNSLYWHILKNYEPMRYQSWGFPAEARFALPDRPALPNPLIPLPADTHTE